MLFIHLLYLNNIIKKNILAHNTKIFHSFLLNIDSLLYLIYFSFNNEVRLLFLRCNHNQDQQDFL